MQTFAITIMLTMASALVGLFVFTRYDKEVIFRL